MEKMSRFTVDRLLNPNEWRDLQLWINNPENKEKVLKYGDKIPTKAGVFFGEYNINYPNGERWHGFNRHAGVSLEGDISWSTKKNNKNLLLSKESFLSIDRKPSIEEFEKLKRWIARNPDKSWHKGDRHPDYEDLIFEEYGISHLNGELWKSEMQIEADSALKIRSKKQFSYFKCRVRSLINNSFYKMKIKKTKSAETILGISFIEFKNYIESQFEPWMNWDVYGTIEGEKPWKTNQCFDLDHIIPLSSAKTVDQLEKLNHYTNFAPLCSYVNRWIKRDSLDFNKPLINGTSSNLALYL